MKELCLMGNIPFITFMVMSVAVAMAREDIGQGGPLADFQQGSQALELLKEGRQLADSGNSTRALMQYRQALKIFRDVGDSTGIANCLLDIGNAHFHLEQYGKAVQCYEEAKGHFRRLNNTAAVTICLQNIASSLYNWGRYEEALPIFQDLDNREGCALCLKAIGRDYFEAGKYQESIEVYTQASAIFHQLGRPQDEVLCQRNIGAAHFWLGRYDEALIQYEEALAYYQQTGDSLEIGQGLECVGQAKFKLNRYEEAISDYHEAADLFHRYGKLDKEALCRRNLGALYFELHKFPHALEQFGMAADYYESVGDTNALAICLRNVGNVDYNLCRYPDALATYTRALELYQALGDKEAEVNCLKECGSVYLTWGETEKALSQYKRAVAIAGGLGLQNLRAQCLVELGAVFCDIGRYEEALTVFEEALTTFRQEKDAKGIAFCFMCQGNVYLDLGRYEKAVDAFEKAFDIYQRIQDLTGQESCLNSLGNVYYELGYYKKALTKYEEAVNIAHELKDFKAESIVRINIGNISSHFERFEEAVTHYEEARGLCVALRFSEGEAICNNNKANVYMRLGRSRDALAEYRQAERIFRRCGIVDELSTVLCNMGAVFENMSMVDSAYYFYKSAVDEIEEIRGGLGRQRILKSFVEKKADLYDRMISLLMRLNRPWEAYQYLQRLKSESLIDALKAGAIKAPNTELREHLKRVGSLDSQIRALERQLMEEQSQPEGKKGSEKIEALARQLASKVGELRTLGQLIRRENPDYVHLVQVVSVEPGRIQAFLPDGAFMVEYYPARNTLYMFLFTSDSFRTVSVSISRDSLYAQIRKFRNFIEDCTHAVNDGRSAPPLGSRSVSIKETMAEVLSSLYTTLIEPLGRNFEQSTTFIVVPSGLLYYIPLQVLAKQKNGGTLEFLLEQKRICYLTDCVILDVLSRIDYPADQSFDIMAFGDPDRTLPGAYEEVKSIRAIYPETVVYTRDEATEGRVVDGSDDCDILHLATHARLNLKDPSKSYIQLARDEQYDGHWLISEILGMNWPHMDLVTLSACETAVGEKEPGREVEALAYAFGVAGARAVVATQWPVYDPSTEKIMMHFYLNLKSMNKVEALRQAQLGLLRHPEYAHPFYWAPFVLIGDWR